MDMVVDEARIERAPTLNRYGPAISPEQGAASPSSIDWRTAMRWVGLLVAPIIVSAGSAFFGDKLIVTPKYAARAELIFQLPAAADLPEQYRATQTVVATGQMVLAPVSDSLGIPIEQVQRNLTVDFPKNSAVMRLEYADPDKVVATDILDRILDQYLNILGEMESGGEATHKLLTPSFAIADPVRPRPMQAAAIGAVLGLAISLAALALVQRSRERS
jgi:capsular polysaccharide biosynthesis protein